MADYIIGNTGSPYSCKVTVKEIGDIIRGKCIEEINEMDENTVDLHLSSQKIIRIKKSENGIEINLCSNKTHTEER